MTEYKSIFKNKVWKIIIYNIPFKWILIEILNYLKAWDNVLAIKFKMQKKYIILIVSINLNIMILN